MRKKQFGMGCAMLIRVAICAIILLIGISRPINKTRNIREVTATVTEKAVKWDRNKSRYLIFTEDEDGTIATYEITDSWLKGRFNSSDLYAAIKEGKKYRLTVGGSRVYLLSWYPNIYEYEEIK